MKKLVLYSSLLLALLVYLPATAHAQRVTQGPSPTPTPPGAVNCGGYVNQWTYDVQKMELVGGKFQITLRMYAPQFWNCARQDWSFLYMSGTTSTGQAFSNGWYIRDAQMQVIDRGGNNYDIIGKPLFALPNGTYGIYIYMCNGPVVANGVCGGGNPTTVTNLQWQNPVVDLTIENMDRSASGYRLYYCNRGSGTMSSAYTYTLSLMKTSVNPFVASAKTGIAIPAAGSCVWSQYFACSALSSTCTDAATMKGIIDTSTQIPETNEANNEYTKSFTVAPTLKTYNITAHPVCSNGRNPVGNFRIDWKKWSDPNLTSNYTAYKSGDSTASVQLSSADSSGVDAAYFGLEYQGSDTNLQPTGTPPHASISYAQWFTTREWYAKVFYNETPAGSYTINYLAPDAACSEQTACTLAGGTWQMFPNSCADKCNAGTFCLQATTFGCNCPNGCWDPVNNRCNNTTPSPTKAPCASPNFCTSRSLCATNRVLDQYQCAPGGTETCCAPAVTATPTPTPPVTKPVCASGETSVPVQPCYFHAAEGNIGDYGYYRTESITGTITKAFILIKKLTGTTPYGGNLMLDRRTPVGNCDPSGTGTGTLDPKPFTVSNADFQYVDVGSVAKTFPGQTLTLDTFGNSQIGSDRTLYVCVSGQTSGCTCGSGDVCGSSCTFNKYANISYANPIKCGLSGGYFSSTLTQDNKNAWCNRPERTKGDANGDSKNDLMDYFYYVGGTRRSLMPRTVNPDFSGDNNIDSTDRGIVTNSINLGF